MKIVSINIMLLILLASCEGVIRMQGYVYDHQTKLPVENARVLLVINRKDTVRNVYYEYDTIDYKDRVKLRKNGFKDDYTYLNVSGYSKKPAPSLTNRMGYFSVGSMLVGCVPKCPGCQLIIIKEGYKPCVFKRNTIVNDSIKIMLERDSGD
jgi:hypothetical protein